ncbi:MAG: outer membrane beta-barrel protein, partial [Thalassolituus sp.]
AYAQLEANNQTLHDNSRYALNRGAASSVELYADDNSNPVPTVTDYSDLGVTGVTAVNDAVNTLNSVLAQIGTEGDNPDTVNSVISVAEMERIIPAITGLVPANQSVYQDYIDANPDNFSIPATAAEVQDMVDAVNAAVIQSAAILAQIGNEADSPDNFASVVTTEELRQILPAIEGVNDDNERLYQDYIDTRPNAFSDPATAGQVQIMVDRVNASQEAMLEILEDSSSVGGSNNANGEAVTVQEIATITGITGVNFDLEAEYQAAINAETGFSNPPTLAEVQALIDRVNAEDVEQAPGNTDTGETAADGNLSFSTSAGSVSLLWAMLAMLLVLARVSRIRRWLAPVVALIAASSVPAHAGVESLTSSEATSDTKSSVSSEVKGEISRLYLTGSGLFSQFAPDANGVDVTSDSDFGLGLGIGYDLTDQFSVEASYLSHGEFRVENNADGSEAALDYSSANVRLNWFPQFIGNQERRAGYSRDGVFSWYLSAGLNYVMGDVTGPVNIEKEQSVVLGYGAGIAYGLADQLDA